MKFLIGILAVAVFASALVVVDAAQRNRDLTREISSHRQAIEKLNVTYAELQLEQGALAAQGRVSRIAHNRLDMHLPSADQIKMVSR